MRIDYLEAKEALFDSTLVDNKGRKFTLLGTEDIGGVQLKKLKIPVTGYYYQEKTKKDMIVIHSTIGVLTGDVGTLTVQDNKVSVSYVIGRNGVVYELFSPDYWSYHLGQGSVSGNKVNSSRSIGIELTNLGPLHLVGGNLETIYSSQLIKNADGTSKRTAQDIYCTIDDVDEYVKLDKPFRSETYFCAYTPQQYKAVNRLTRYLCGKYDIPLNFHTGSSVFSESVAKSFTGICSHVNYRPSGKWDVGPDFNWGLVSNEIIQITEKPKEQPKEPVKEPTPLTPNTGLPPFIQPTQPNVTIRDTPKSIFGGFLSRFLK